MICYESTSSSPYSDSHPSSQVPAAALAKFKFKLKAHKNFTLVWCNKGSGAHNDVHAMALDLPLLSHLLLSSPLLLLLPSPLPP